MGSIMDSNDKNDENIKIYWTQKQISNLLKQSAEEFISNYDTYDSLIVITSCHGINNNIITSDYQLIDKDYIHRFYSVNYKQIRKKPRIFIFDCCDGDEQRNTCTNNDGGKNLQVKDLKVTNIWLNDDENPDHELVLVHAANTGFQSKMDTEDGSYLLTEFNKRTIQNIGNEKSCYRKHKCIGELFNDIQNDLHQKGKQQTVNTFSNKSYYLKFRKYNGDTIKLSQHLQLGYSEDTIVSSCLGNDKTKYVDKIYIDEDIKEIELISLHNNDATKDINTHIDEMKIKMELGNKIMEIYKANRHKEYIQNEMMKQGYNSKQIDSCFSFLGIESAGSSQSTTDYSKSIDIQGLNDILNDHVYFDNIIDDVDNV